MSGKLFLFFGMYLSSNFALGQNNALWNWPEDRIKAEENIALYSDYLGLKDYRQAANYLHWLLVNAPDLSISLYQNGSTIYENLAVKTSDKVEKEIFLDSMLWMYDTRMAYFDDSVNVMNRKVFKAYKHYKRKSSKLEYLLSEFDLTFRISGMKIINSNLPAYMNVVKMNKLTLKNLSAEEVLERYNGITNIIDRKIAEGEDLKDQKDLIDKLLTEAIPEAIDCDFVKEKMGPEFYSDPTNSTLAKKVFNFMWQADCTDEALFMAAAQTVHRNEPTYTIGYKIIGKRCLVEKDYACAKRYFEEAIQLAQSDEEKIDVLIDLAKLSSLQNDKVESRANFRKVLQIDPGNKEALNGIGNLYFYSAEECSKYESKVMDRLVYIAAFEKFQKAGNRQMMDASRQQFPSKQDIFLENLVEGEEAKINCWINETVALVARPSEN